MPEYAVHFTYTTGVTLDVTAENEAAAIEKAKDELAGWSQDRLPEPPFAEDFDVERVEPASTVEIVAAWHRP